MHKVIKFVSLTHFNLTIASLFHNDNSHFPPFSNKNRNKGWNYGDDYILVTHPPTLSNTSWHNNNVSWEAQEEIYTLSDAISQDDIMGLRPIFRKDLPDKYVAYWEAKLNGKTGEKYVIISAGKYMYSVYG